MGWGAETKEERGNVLLPVLALCFLPFLLSGGCRGREGCWGGLWGRGVERQKECLRARLMVFAS